MKYYQHGLCAIGLTHGNNEKVADLPLLMATENPQLWAATKYREWHLGHIHHKREIKFVDVAENKGCTVRFMRSLAGTDAWHAQKGFLGSVKGAEGFVWNPESGLIGQFNANI